MRMPRFHREYCNPLHFFLLADNCGYCLLRRFLKGLKKTKLVAPPEDNHKIDAFLKELSQ